MSAMAFRHHRRSARAPILVVFASAMLVGSCAARRVREPGRVAPPTAKASAQAIGGGHVDPTFYRALERYTSEVRALRTAPASELDTRVRRAFRLLATTLEHAPLGDVDELTALSVQEIRSAEGEMSLVLPTDLAYTSEAVRALDVTATTFASLARGPYRDLPTVVAQVEAFGTEVRASVRGRPSGASMTDIVAALTGAERVFRAIGAEMPGGGH